MTQSMRPVTHGVCPVTVTRSMRPVTGVMHPMAETMCPVTRTTSSVPPPPLAFQGLQIRTHQPLLSAVQMRMHHIQSVTCL
eukprot:CAMPEP_0173062346 /NCGR_PEP_ID=MMETSP1102-20130122/3762_1 /TAXON_ID=49646 /ORGANISM="Geminigera sp., Strain Caron Lab Isolate" /LENGTH=80 /DNA_ID=CAMNT_0013928997 /DNA_START=52 /DNA_END=294 /DNA_ORIENTATION=-